jgi:nucleotide-binding universal stress UspA family protein
MNILLAADGSDFTRRMLAYIVAHEDWLGTNHRYTVVHATPKVSGHAAAFIDQDTLKAYYQDEAEKVFAPIRVFFRQHGIDAVFLGFAGHVAKSIAKQASGMPCDLLMMGSHGHGNLGNLVMGSVATQVLAQCKVPVLLVR